MIIISSIILTLYCILIIAFIIGVDRVENFNEIAPTYKTKFSIVIPFRNEAKNLKPLLESLSKLNYPKELYEILFVDDDSQDDSVGVLQRGLDCARPDIQILRNIRKSGSPKKDAVETAIKQSRFDWILTTDADCIVPHDWLLIFDTFIQQHKPTLIAAPVAFKKGNSFVEKFQQLDLLSLQGSTIGGFGLRKPFLCNGANLCYKKQAFLELNGFEGNEHIASGDDIFLLEKMTDNYPEKVTFLKSDKAIIKTNAEPKLQELISQRVRWAAKATSYRNTFSMFVSITVFSTNAFLIILFLGSSIGYYSWQFLAFFFIVKFCLDFILLYKTARFFKQQGVLKHYFWSSLVYPIFIIFIALTSFRSGYSWKGRRYQQ